METGKEARSPKSGGVRLGTPAPKGPPVPRGRPLLAIDQSVWLVYPGPMAKTWQLQEAKARFSKLVEEALKGEPQLVTRRGRKAVVVLDWETYARLTGEKLALWQALRAPTPLPNDEAEALFARTEAEHREVSLF
jgi:prevent-host-death family protein